MNPDGSVRMRLTQHPPTKWADISDDCKSVLATNFNISCEADWVREGEKVCTLCGMPDHYLKHCVRVWACTKGGQKFLGSAKAAEFAARLRSGEGGRALSVFEFVDLFENLYHDESEREMLVENLAYVCEICDVGDADGDSAAMIAVVNDACELAQAPSRLASSRPAQ